METQIDHNAYSALGSDSEESDSSELSALLANPDLGSEKPLSIKELQEPSEPQGASLGQTVRFCSRTVANVEFGKIVVNFVQSF